MNTYYALESTYYTKTTSSNGARYELDMKMMSLGATNPANQHLYNHLLQLFRSSSCFYDISVVRCLAVPCALVASIISVGTLWAL